jgi:hypothetical protein
MTVAFVVATIPRVLVALMLRLAITTLQLQLTMVLAKPTMVVACVEGTIPHAVVARMRLRAILIQMRFSTMAHVCCLIRSKGAARPAISR